MRRSLACWVPGRVGGRMLIPALLLLALATVPADAAKVVLRIRAGNPIDKEQPVEIRSPLPAGVGTNNILSLGGLDLGYDDKTAQYFVFKTLVLGPKQIMVFDVEIDDIWTIPEEQLARYEAHAAALAAKLTDHVRYKQSSQALLTRVSAALSDIRQKQAANAIGTGVKPIDHIRVYEANMDFLKKVRTDVGRMENLVLYTNQDPGEMMGDDQNVPKPEQSGRQAPDTGKTAVIQIVVENPSPTRRRTDFGFTRNLPPEIRPQDVLDTGGLSLGVNEADDITYVSGEGLEIAPGATLTFAVTVKNRWDVNTPRIERLHAEATNMLSKVAARGKFVSVEEKLKSLVTQIAEVRSEVAPTELDATYINFFRTQADRLDAIEQDLQRIVINLPQIDLQTKLGFTPQAPTMKTTWLIIWLILGFLALVSLIFFLRWSGRSKAETHEAQDRPAGGG